MRSQYILSVLTITLITAGDLIAGSEESEKQEWTLVSKIYGDKRARRVGDLVTVLIEEANNATKDAQNKSANKSAVSGSASVGHPTVDATATAWTNAAIPKWSLDTSRSFEGGGSLANKDSFSSKLTARVTEVLPNGNLLIEGKRNVTLQDETVEITLTGTIRPADIATDNTIASSSIADAVIKYGSGGPIAKNQQKGMLSKVIDWINPF